MDIKDTWLYVLHYSKRPLLIMAATLLINHLPQLWPLLLITAAYCFIKAGFDAEELEVLRIKLHKIEAELEKNTEKHGE